MKRITYRIVLAVIAISGCTFSSTTVVELPPEPFYLEDVSGRRWDFTHAVSHYGFDPEQFGASKGPFTRPPINEPQMLSPEDPAYPPDDATVEVIATATDAESRAYAVADIVRNEVLNDRFVDAHVTVAY